MKTLISTFPLVMKSAFVSDGKIGSEDVRRKLSPNPGVLIMDENQLHVWEYLLAFIDQADEKGLFVTMHTCTYTLC